MSHGIFPFCVHQEPPLQLQFRRSTGPGEKDKTQRLADAAEDLQNCPDVVWYNSTIGMNNAAPLHVQPGTLSVQWSIQNQDADVHM